MVKIIPLTELMTGTSCLFFAGMWLYVRYRTRKAHMTVAPSLKYLTNYFGWLAIFVFIMTVPYLWLSVSPAAFSTAMAWGYVVGHIFLYISFMYIALMVCELLPSLNNKIPLVVTVFLLADVVTTIINAKTMIWGIQPVYDAAHNLTYLQPAAAVGAAIGIMSLLSIFPAIILFAQNAFRSKGARRLKSVLMVVGFALIMVGGPLNDNSHTTTMYLAAVIIVILGDLILGTGVGFRLESGLADAPAPVPSPAKIASSNTV
ncbi:MAG TPA: hypothetical protein VGH44_02005 [Candidatus Saccharimonadia bacterium]|jgi:hypothetical protein